MNAQAQIAPASVDAVVEALSRDANAGSPTVRQDFVRAFLARMSQDEIESRSPEAWAAILGSMLRFMAERQPGSAKVRVFNPGEAGDGIDSSHTLVQIVNDDMPFLVDSVRMALTQFDVSLYEIAHPVFKVSRDAQGQLAAIGSGTAESLMYVEIDRQADDALMHRIEGTILNALADVRACVRDWAQMRERMAAIAEELSTRTMPAPAEVRAEAQAFLRWAADNHFTFLGYREYDVVRKGGSELLCADESTGLGLLRG
ncbi:MAG TPA: NAD-glutamate dehydrogenase, partial [Arenimonas sp.]|nr:NAD-glutamate dehydrogenase [Arenimonas sp.]